MRRIAQQIERIGSAIEKDLPEHWDGKRAITEMKEGGSRHWRQMEWIGFYFEFVCEKCLDGIMECPGPKYGNVGFDGFLEIPWDFKCHAVNSRSSGIIVNDRNAIEKGIEEYGTVGVVLALGNATYNDDDGTFKAWHDEQKGGQTKYVRERIRRGAKSRLRKIAFHMKEIKILYLDTDVLKRSSEFQKDFRNAGGQPRKRKVLLSCKDLDPITLWEAKF